MLIVELRTEETVGYGKAYFVCKEIVPDPVLRNNIILKMVRPFVLEIGNEVLPVSRMSVAAKDVLGWYEGEVPAARSAAAEG